MPIVLCVISPSEGFRAAIEKNLQEAVEYMPLAAVKTKGSMRALRFLAGQNTDSVYVAFEGAQEMIMMPIITVLSFIIRARRRFIIRPDMTISPIKFADLGKAIVNAFVGSLAAVKSGIVAYLELHRLERLPNPARPAAPISRVVYLSTNVNLGVKAGGSLGHIAGVVNDLHRRGFDLTYVATRRLPVIDRSVPMKTLHLPRALGLPMDLFIFGFSQHIYSQMRGMFSSSRPAVVYQRMSRSDYSGAKLSRRDGVPLIMEYNGSEAWGARHWGHPMFFERLARRAELVSLRAAHTVVTISDVLADELVDIGIPKSRIVVYPNCVDSTVFDSARFPRSAIDALRARHGITADATVLGFIGTFGKWHGVDVLCATIKELAAEHGAWLDQHNVRFLIVGDGFLGRSVQELISDDNVKKYVSWPGLVEQTEGPVHLAAMDILLSPHVPNADGSKFFGSPTKLFEYMSMGRAIVASRLDQIEQVLSPALAASDLPEHSADAASRELAILAEPGSVPELINAIKFAVERRDWRDSLARNAREEVLRKYQWSHHVDKIIAGAGFLAKPSQPIERSFSANSFLESEQGNVASLNAIADHQRQMASLKEDVRTFWNTAVCGAALLDSADAAGYALQSERRFTLEPFIANLARFSESRGKRVLEIGVGLGADHQRFAEAGAKLFGIDLTERAVEHTIRRLRLLGLPSRVTVGDAERLNFPDQYFDVVYSWGVLHHSPDTQKAVGEVFRVLKKGGAARIMVYHKWSVVGMMLWFRYGALRLRPWTGLAHIYSRYLESPGTKAYSVAEARELFRDFTDVRITTRLGHGDLLDSEAGQRHRGPMLSLARAVWPRRLLKRFCPGLGLFMLIEAQK